MKQLFKNQEECHGATKELVKELEDFLQIEDQAEELKDRKETMTAIERMLELIAHISDYISEHATTRRLGEEISMRILPSEAHNIFCRKYTII